MTSDRRREALPTDGFRRWLSTVKWPAGEFPHQVAAWLDSVEADLARTHIPRECPPCVECKGSGEFVRACTQPGDHVCDSFIGPCPACDGGKKGCGECHKCAEEKWRQVALNEREVERKYNAAQLAAKDADLRAVVEAAVREALEQLPCYFAWRRCGHKDGQECGPEMSGCPRCAAIRAMQPTGEGGGG